MQGITRIFPKPKNKFISSVVVERKVLKLEFQGERKSIRYGYMDMDTLRIGILQSRLNEKCLMIRRIRVVVKSQKIENHL